MGVAAGQTVAPEPKWAYGELGVGRTFLSEVGPLKIVSLLGSGSYGEVFKVKHSSGRFLALKHEKEEVVSVCPLLDSPKGMMTLAYEYEMLKRMNGRLGFPKLYGSGDGYYLMQLLDEDVLNVPISKLPGVAVQMVDRLQTLHTQGLLMHDVHPGNFMQHRGIVYAIDFSWVVPINGKPAVESFCRHRVFGTAGDTGTAKDDLIRLMYSLVYMSRGHLPWQPEESPDRVDELKRTSSAREVCRGASWLVPAYKYVSSLEPGAKVDYLRLRALLLKVSPMRRLWRLFK